MDVREKLIELIESARYWCAGTSEEIADRLLANGVTIQRWIPVTERLPEEDGKYFVLTRVGCIPDKSILEIALWTHKFDGHDPMMRGRALWFDFDPELGVYEVTDVTHWMRIPEVTKENDYEYV